MLPTNEATILHRDTLSPENKIELSSYKKPIADYSDQHPYILSDEEIKEGDWYLTINNHETLLHRCRYKGTNVVDNFEKDECHKIIATTNPELLPLKYRDTPLESRSSILKGVAFIPEDFIEAYIREYNAGHPIEKVMIEYETRFLNNANTSELQRSEFIEVLKLRPDGTVIISKIKERMFTIEDMIDAFVEGFNRKQILYTATLNRIEIGKWIDKNYPAL